MKARFFFVMFLLSGLISYVAETQAFEQKYHKNSYGSSQIFLPYIKAPFSLSNVGVCSGGPRVIALLIDPLLLEDTHDNIRQYAQDLCADGFTVIERESTFADPGAVRGYLSQLHSQTDSQLTGALMIGDIPYAYQWIRFEFTNPDIPPLEEEVISFQYYADLDGYFGVSPNYISPGGHDFSFDIHSGEMDWEIWIGVLPMYEDDYSLTTEAINTYFLKNHAYRNGSYDIPRAFLQITEHFSASTLEEHNRILGFLTDGVAAWTPFSNSSNAHFFFDSAPVGLTVMQGYSNMSAGIADFTVADTHGSGQIDDYWVETNPVNTVFFWSNGCAVGNLNKASPFLAGILYSSTSKVLTAYGTTNESGGMGFNENGFYGHNIATSLSNGATFGQALLDHVNVPLAEPPQNRELYFALPIVLGDPSLRLRQ